MANPRELAEKAFALLQNALHESEARASDLDEQLKRKRTPKNRLEEQLDVLTHRLESVEAERLRWEQQAGHLEEIAEAERVKVAQLKKKLEIAESGPEKLTKKEVNFWRAKAETIDAQIKEYQERLNGLRRELNERDVLLEKLQSSGSTAPAAPAPSSPQSDFDGELRRQLEQRDQWLAELRLELHELRGHPAPPLETQAEVETLRSQITGLERALAEAHNLRAAAQADVMRAAHEIAAHELAVREAQTASERTRTTIVEREHRIVELAAEVEQMRSELRRRDELDRDVATRYEEQIAGLTRDIDALRSRIEQDRHDSGAARAALELALHEREREIENQRQLLAAHERDSGELRLKLAEGEQAAAEARRQIEEQQHEMRERERELADRQQQLRDLNLALTERDQRSATWAAELDHLRETRAAQGAEIDSLRQTLQSAHQELERARAATSAHELELAELRSDRNRAEAALADAESRAAAAARDAETAIAHAESRAALAARDAETAIAEVESRAARDIETAIAEAESRTATVARDIEAARAEAESRAAAAAHDLEAARELLASLETELKEEREHAESLGELANERREHMTKLQEQVEEAEERYADANWRLGKSLYFERIVKRRKGLIKKLLEALRAKMKANVALKAGLDGLRTFKQTAEANQHKLLQRIDGLKAQLKEAEEAIKRHQGGTAAKEELTNTVARATALETQLTAQAELIQSLEGDLKAARLAHKTAEEKQIDIRPFEQEIERLAKETERFSKDLEVKNEIIGKLQVESDEQQRKLAKLRSTESEVVRLKAVTEKDRGEIDLLQREVAELRKALVEQAAAAAAAAKTAELEAKLKEREGSLTRLMGTIKDHETTIRRLNEAVDSWKRKYQFLSTDQPDAYKHANGEK